jgi:hypothetical protein
MKNGVLSYNGDVTHIVGETKGPSQDGKMFIATDAVYDSETNKTRVEFDEYHPFKSFTMEVNA